MTRDQFRRAHHFARSMRRVMEESRDDASLLRLALPPLQREFHALKAQGLEPFSTLTHQSSEWVAGFVPPQHRREVWGRRRLYRIITGRRVKPAPLPR